MAPQEDHPTTDMMIIDTDDQFPPHPNFYEILTQIGGGDSSSPATVFKATCATNSSPVAIKVINFEKSSTRLDSDQFTLLHTFLDHPNLLKPHCSFTVDPNRLWVVMPYISGGSLQFTGGLKEPIISVVLERLLHALFYIHCQGYFHGDVKPGNILIDSNGAVKLGDLGYSVSVYGSESRVPYWSAPEVVDRSLCSPMADIWSFGVAALELVHGRPPLSIRFYDRSLGMTEEISYRNEIKFFSSSFRDMVGLCLNRDPSKRPSAGRLLDHQFFKKCKGADFLVPNLVEGLPDIEKRFSMNMIEDDEDRLMNQRRVVGWEFNAVALELDPVFEGDGKRVSSGEGTAGVVTMDTDEDSGEKRGNAGGASMASGSSASAGEGYGGITRAAGGGGFYKKGLEHLMPLLDKNLDTTDEDSGEKTGNAGGVSMTSGSTITPAAVGGGGSDKKLSLEQMPLLDKNLVADADSGEKSGNESGGSKDAGSPASVGGGVREVTLGAISGGFSKKEVLEELMARLDKNLDVHKQQVAELSAMIGSGGMSNVEHMQQVSALENEKKKMYEMEKKLQSLKVAIKSMKK